jgi:ketosteroid isomerase-like protein
VEVWRIQDGKLASLHNYFDTLTLLQQLGISQPPG